MRGDKSALPIEMYLSPESERHIGRSLQRYTLTGLRTLQGCNPKGAPACRPAPRSPTGREAAPSKAYLQNYSKTSPTSTRPKHREPKFLPARAGALGGSSGRMREAWREKGHPPKGGPFSLQGLSFSPPQKFSAAPMTVPNWEFSGIRKRTPNPPDAVIDSKTRRIGAIVVRLPVRTMSRRL